ncbi:lysosomal alpha-glucosidase-like isoform X2 [Lycorma delicatula]|uniref:lysosomal alpha-glucosidase-like isoform X2 n=1 Tax=Lycorma delicatula TaxID=130591 RepID=UPI003F5128FF
MAALNLNENKKGMHYFVIMDPGVSGREPNGTYSPYDDVIAQDILMKDFTGNKPLIGRVWNDKSTVFPDYTNPETVKYWMEQISRQQREQF